MKTIPHSTVQSHSFDRSQRATVKPRKSTREACLASAPLAGSVATLLAAAAFSGVLSPCAQAASATWTATTNGAWSTGGNWSGGSPASGAGNVADFSTLDLTSDVTVTLDSARTIGALLFGDIAPSNNWVLSGTGSNILTLDNTGGSGAPTIQVNNRTATISATLAGAAGFTKSGTGTLVLTGNNTYAGPTAIASGTLTLQSGYGSSGFAIGSGAVLELNVASGSRDGASTTFSGAGTLLKTGTGQMQWGASSATFALGSGGLIDVEAGNFIGGSSANEVWTNNLSNLKVASGATFNGVEANVRVNALSGSGTIQSGYGGGGYQNFTIGVDNGSGTFGGVIANSNAAANIVKSGTGTQILSGPNTYNGTTTVSGGRLVFVDNRSGGSTFTVAGGATLEFNTATGDQQLSGGTISGSGTLVKSGSSTLFLGGGGGQQHVSMSGGLIDVQGGSVLGGWSNGDWTNNKASLNVASGATVDLWDNPAGITVDALTGSGTVQHTSYGNAENFTVGVNNGSGTFAGTITDAGGHVLNLVKTGTGTQTLTGALTYSGATIINSGTLEFQAIPASGTMTIASGATLAFNIGSASSMNGTTITGTGTFVKTGTGNLVFGNGVVNMNLSTGALIDVQAGSIESSTWSRGIWTNNYADLNVALGAYFNLKENQVYIGALSGGGTIFQGYAAASPALTIGRGDRSGTFSGVIQGGASIEKVGAGTQIFTGANTYSGSTAISGGTLQIGNGGTTGSLQAGSAISGSTGATLAFNRSDAVTITNTISGGLGVIQSGSGTTVLTGSNSYSGGTAMSGGTLRVGNTNALGTGGMTVNNGTLDLANYSVNVSALSGSAGTITNTVSGTSTLTTVFASGTSTYNGNIANATGAIVLTQTGSGTLILGGSLAIAGLNAEGGATRIRQSGSIGALNVAAGATVSITAHSGSSYTVLDISSLTISGSTSGLAAANSATPATAAPALLNADALGALSNTSMLAAAGQTGSGGTPAAEPNSPEAVPEPGTLGLLVAGALGLLGFRRKATGASRS